MSELHAAQVSFDHWDERALDLAATLVTEGLNEHELDELHGAVDARELEAWEFAATELALCGLDELERPPGDLLQRLERDAFGHACAPADAPSALRAVPASSESPTADAHSTAEGGGRGPLSMSLAWAGWLAALVLGLLTLVPDAGSDLDRARQLGFEAVAARANARASWAATEDALGQGVEGEAVWSTADQAGWMRFDGLAVNDPAVEQYQLWIFDTARPDWEEHPVDGGVFDVGTEGEVYVPIEAKLGVDSPALFAVTLEAPGGVVVSTRERLLLTGSVQ